MRFSWNVTMLAGAFALSAVGSLVNAACSAPADVDQGSTESASSERGPYGYAKPPPAYGGYNGGYYGGGDLADDDAEF